MLGFLKELKSWVRVSPHPWDHVSVDTVVSALHHRITSAILLMCCALVSSRQYFGEPILCIQDGLDDDTAIPSNVLNTYCFITSTYTVVEPEGMVVYCTLLIQCCKILKLLYLRKHHFVCF
jgi:Innexin.